MNQHAAAPADQAPLEVEPSRNTEPTPNLSKALLVAQKGAGTIGKDSSNNFHDYDYTSADAMIDMCRKLLHEAGITARRGSWTWAIVHQQEAVFDNGQLVVKPCLTANVQQTFILEHAESGEKLIEIVHYPAIEEKGRPMDKGVAGALTTAMSYWLRDQLLIPRISKGQDDRDDRQHGDQRQKTKSGGGGGGGRQDKPKPEACGAATNGNPVTKDTIKTVEYDKFKNKPDAKKVWSKHLITTDKGIEYTTFDLPVAQKAKQFEGTGELCWIEYETSKWGNDIKNIQAKLENAPEEPANVQEEPGADG